MTNVIKLEIDNKQHRSDACMDCRFCVAEYAGDRFASCAHGMMAVIVTAMIMLSILRKGGEN